jgi:hypothetical protein
VIRPQRVWRAVFGPYPVDRAYQWRGTPIDGRPFLRVAHFGDCLFREMPLSHGIHTMPGYPCVLGERLGWAGLGMEFSTMMVARFEHLPQTPDALTTYLKLTGDPDVVLVHTGGVYSRLQVLPSTHEILRMREDVGRALGRRVFVGYAALRPTLRAFGRWDERYAGAEAVGGHLRAVRERWPHARVAVIAPFERATSRRQARLCRRITDDVRAQAAAAGVAFLDCTDLLPAERRDLRCANRLNVNAAGSRLVGDRLADWVLAGTPEHQLAGAGERRAGGLGAVDELA